MIDYKIAGDRGILIQFGNEVNEENFQKTISFEQKIQQGDLPGVLETIRGYCSLWVFYDPAQTDHKSLMNQLKQLNGDIAIGEKMFSKDRIIEIPIIYGGHWGPDLAFVGNYFHLSEEEVIERHLSHDYLIYINAHLAGAAFFKGSDGIFDIPRKKTPVLQYPEGAVLLANGLGVVFIPLATPSGWYAIGRSPLRQWYPDQDPPVLIKSGDWIRYRRIEENEFREIKNRVDQNAYELRIYEAKELVNE